MRHSLKRTALAALLSTTSGYAFAQQVVSAPTVSVPPASGHPYNAAAYQKVPQNLGASGYVEAEYFLSGQAQAYTYLLPFSQSEAAVPLPGGAVPYTNRILVRAPADPTKFSGNVIVEIINDALVGDNLVQWPYANSQFIANGDVWIGMTSQPNAIAALDSFEPARYGALSWPGLPSASGCSASATTEPGLVYDQITALGKLIRQPSSLLNPGGAYKVKAVYLTSYSAASQILLTYNRVFDSQNPGLWDAYMVSSGGLRAPLNACENGGAAYFRLYGPASKTAAVMQTQTISETEGTIAANGTGGVPTSGADSDAPTNRYRYYDLAGSSHVNDDLVHAQPNSNDLAAAHAVDANQQGAYQVCGDTGPLSDFPNRYVYDALWTNLEAWVRNGTLPPHAPTMNYVQSSQGTPVGGLRTPGVDAPLFSYYGGHATSNQTYQTICSVTGYEVPIPYSQLVSMYGTVNGYVAAVQTAAQKDAAAGYLTPADEANIIAHPTSSAGY